MKTLFKRVLDNSDAALAILMSIVAGVFGIFGGSAFISVLLSAISGTLALLAFGLVRDRFARDHLLQRVESLDKSLQIIQDRPSADAFFKDRSSFVPLQQTIATARQVCLLGPSLINTVTPLVGYLHYEKLNNHGAEIQILLLDPDFQAAINSAAKLMNTTTELLQNDIKVTILNVGSMIREGVKAGSISVKLMSVVPNVSMVLIDPDKSNGRIFVEFIGYHARIYDRPHIELIRHRDGMWYEFFLQQYRQMWEDSRLRLTSETTE